LGLFQDTHKNGATERAVVVNGEVDGITPAGDGYFLTLVPPGAVLDFAKHGHVGFPAGAKIEHHAAAQVAVRAFDLCSAANHNGSGEDNDACGKDHILQMRRVHGILLHSISTSAEAVEELSLSLWSVRAAPACWLQRPRLAAPWPLV